MTNYITTLFTKIREKGMEPLSALETLATNAEESGFIDGIKHKALRYLVPFQDFRRMSLNAVGRMFHMTHEEAKQLESAAYAGLIRYVETLENKTRSQQQEHSETVARPNSNEEIERILDGQLYDLPFQECPNSTRVINALNKRFKSDSSFGRNPTPREVRDLIMTMRQNGTKFCVRGFGRSGYRRLVDAYSRIGIEMPQFDYVNSRFF